MATVMQEQTQNRKINPLKFAMWISIASIIMMFAGFTSGFIVRKSQGNWIDYSLPIEFYISTAVVIISSITIHLAYANFKKGNTKQHKNYVLLSLLLGIGFVLLQYFGFKDMFAQIRWDNNVSFQFLLVIVLLHAIHITGGVVALLILFARTFSKKLKPYTRNGFELMLMYWHFVDILWIYLFIFFLINE